MTAFKIYFFAISLILFFSCEEKNAIKVINPSVTNRRLLAIKEVTRVMPNNSFMYYNRPKDHLFELTIKNVSGFDLDYYYRKEFPFWAGACLQYINFPSTAECMFFEDTSRVIKKNEEFRIQIPLFLSNSEFYKYTYQGINFKLLISNSKDLSFYFEGNPSKPKYKKIILDGNNGRRKYAYPLEFTYWVSIGIFWEQYLLE
jgi:hypothetical protein